MVRGEQKVIQSEFRGRTQFGENRIHFLHPNNWRASFVNWNTDLKNIKQKFHYLSQSPGLNAHCMQTEPNHFRVSFVTVIYRSLENHWTKSLFLTPFPRPKCTLYRNWWRYKQRRLLRLSIHLPWSAVLWMRRRSEQETMVCNHIKLWHWWHVGALSRWVVA